MIDPIVKDTRDVTEAMRCIHVGMLCTQDSVIHRPNMGSVLLMLESQTSQLPPPRQPTFHSFLNSGDIELNFDGHDVASVNDVTFTTIVGRWLTDQKLFFPKTLFDYPFGLELFSP